MQPNRLVYDVGMHRGEDSEFYLSRGCRVIGVEANPELAAFIRQKFSSEITRGQLHIVEKAISRVPGKVRLGVNREMAIWSSISEIFLERNAAAGAHVDFIEVDGIPFDEVLREHGIPYYAKIDIEGMDMLCVEALHHFPERPKYISIESAVTAGVAEVASAFTELAHLFVLGYRRFKYIDQAALAKMNGALLTAEGPPMPYRHRPDSSGPFGEESPGTGRQLTLH